MNRKAHLPDPSGARSVRPPAATGRRTESWASGPAQRPASPPRPVAFTLLELLVVVAILGILASLLVPALAKARHSARAAQCASNLRQFGLAAEMYWDDHDGAAFRYRGSATNGGDNYWFGWLERGEEGHRRFDPSAGALWPYFGARGVEICAALRPNASDFKPKASALGGTGGYGYNLSLSAPPGQSAFRMTSLPCPAGLAIFADAAQVNDFQPPASPDRPMLEEFHYLSTNEPTAHFRHQSRATVGFADGHVIRVRPANRSLDPRLPSARVGRLPEEMLRP